MLIWLYKPGFLHHSGPQLDLYMHSLFNLFYYYRTPEYSIAVSINLQHFVEIPDSLVALQ